MELAYDKKTPRFSTMGQEQDINHKRIYIGRQLIVRYDGDMVQAVTALIVFRVRRSNRSAIRWVRDWARDRLILPGRTIQLIVLLQDTLRKCEL